MTEPFVHPRPPVAVGLAAVLLGLCVILAGASAFAGRSIALAWLLAVCATVGVVSLLARTPATVLVSVTAAVVTAICWTVVEARSRHVLDLAAPAVVGTAALLLVRPDSRDYLAGAVDVHGSGQTSTDGS